MTKEPIMIKLQKEQPFILVQELKTLNFKLDSLVRRIDDLVAEVRKQKND